MSETIDATGAEKLRNYIERIERLEEEKKALSDDIKDILSEAKSTGYNVKTIRAVIKIRKLSPTDAEHQEELLDIYKAALKM